MPKKAAPRTNRKAPRKTKTAGNRRHVFLDDMELLLINKHMKSKRLSFSAAVCQLSMNGLKAEEMAQASAATALALMSETVNFMAAELSLMREEMGSGQSLTNANFEALHKTSVGAYLASRQLVAKLDAAGFDRLDPLTKSYLSKLGIDRDTAVASESKQRAVTT